MDLVARLVGVTLGPKGRNVVLANKYGPPKIVNDGETVLKEVLPLTSCWPALQIQYMFLQCWGIFQSFGVIVIFSKLICFFYCIVQDRVGGSAGKSRS